MTFRAVLFFFLALIASTAFAAPTVEQVYAAAHAGRLNEADSMIREVLKENPDSAKAHYVHAQILAAKRDNTGARAELEQAEKLAPGLPFAKPGAVSDLRAKIGASTGTAHKQDFSWTPLLLLGLVAIGLYFLIRLMRSSRRYQVGQAPSYAQNSAYPAAAPPAAAPGMGSSIASGLATGLGVGAGIVAGEALAHSLFDHKGNEAPQTPPPNVDVGGNDFGLNDTSWGNGGDGGGDVGGDW